MPDLLLVERLEHAEDQWRYVLSERPKDPLLRHLIATLDDHHDAFQEALSGDAEISKFVPGDDAITVTALDDHTRPVVEAVLIEALTEANLSETETEDPEPTRAAVLASISGLPPLEDL